MRKSQIVHLGMINSYNVITEAATVEDVIKSGIGVFAHSLNESDALESIEFMILYFKGLEMYERCAKLKTYIEETFDEDGNYKEQFCQCEMPEVLEYKPKVKCATCNMRLKTQ
jgi:hypothetical protein